MRSIPRLPSRLRNMSQRVDAAVFAKNKSLFPVRRIAVVQHNFSVIPILAGGNVKSNKVRHFAFAFSVIRQRCARQIVERMAVSAQLQTKVTIFKFVGHAALLGWLRRQAGQYFNSTGRGVEAEEVP